MSEKRVVMVIDMQQGVFATPRLRPEQCVARINQLTQAADTVIFIQHTESGGLEEGCDGFALLPELQQPEGAFYVTKTACDAFYKTGLDALLRELEIDRFVICGCATDYCVDATLKNGVSRGYHITVAKDAHTTANRAAATAETLINHYNDVWSDFIAPGNEPLVKLTETILAGWKTN